MNMEDCIRFANENPICYLATAERDQPRVRALGFWFADETGFYFQTATMKELPGQLENNPKAEVAFYKHEGITGTLMRVAGKVEFIEDPVLQERVLRDRPFLEPFKEEVIIFRIAHGEAYFWTLTNNLEPKQYIRF